MSRGADEAAGRYTSGEYLKQHADWHLGDAPGKALDIFPSISAILRHRNHGRLTVADIGAGVGGVLHELGRLMAREFPGTEFIATGFEIAPEAVARAHELFPDLDLRNEYFGPESGTFDVALLIDVLEHLENPRAMLRIAANGADYLVVRQPLLESFSTFRHDNYRTQREHWGHIAYFNVASFMELADSTGWEPIESRLLGPWELKAGKNRGSMFKKLLTRWNRRIASHFLSGFYLNAAFVRKGFSGKGQA